MTALNDLLDGESTIVVSTQKYDEESGPGPLSARTEISAALSETRTMSDSEKSAEFSVDGTTEGWTCVIGGWFALFATFGWLNS
jgi:hypothetical protein